MNMDKSSLQRNRRRAETLFTQEGKPEMKHTYLFIVEPGCKHNLYDTLIDVSSIINLLIPAGCST
jgi:hypothetical protein